MQCYLELSADSVKDPHVRAAYEYWGKARSRRLMPSRKDIDPLDLTFCLGWISLIDVLYEPGRRFKYRLDGSKLTLLTGWDMTGLYLDDMKDEIYRDFVFGIYNRVADASAPVFMRNFEQWKNLDYITESVTLLLSEDGERVTGLVDVIVPTRRPLSRSGTATSPKVLSKKSSVVHPK